MGLFGLCPLLTLPKYWSCQISSHLFGVLPIFWLPMGPLLLLSQILAKILANPRRQKSAPRN
jgi:hypothetical protein